MNPTKLLQGLLVLFGAPEIFATFLCNYVVADLLGVI
jgi:hypothetical protein